MPARFCILQKPISTSVEINEKYVLHFKIIYARQIMHITHLMVLSIRKINMETLYQENIDNRMKIQVSAVAFKILMLLKVPDHVLIH